MKKILIVGGGFAGLRAAKALGSVPGVQVVLIDRHNYHLFQPLLYQVATAGLSPAEIAAPIRGILASYKSIEVILGDVHGVRLQEWKVDGDFGSLTYDYLILACGSQHSYFGHDDWEPFAPGLKTVEQATEIRRRILLAFERAERESDQERRRQFLTFVIVGGGPTGVELAGAIGELSRYTLCKDFRSIDPRSTRVILIEAGPRVLPSFTVELSQRAARDLEKLGVTIWTSSRVEKVSALGVALQGGEFLHASTVIWAAGVAPSKVNRELGVPLDSQGRILVEQDLSVKGFAKVFVLGDQAHFEADGKPLPGLAAVAMQQGEAAAENIRLDLLGKPRRPFHYFDKGQMATIGRSKAVLMIGNFRATGFVAWVLWLLVHIYYLIGFKNRLFVLYQWVWAYLTYRRGARLIINKDWKD